MGNDVSIQGRAEAKAEELALVQAVLSGDVEALQATLKQAPQLVNAHSRAGENLWHFAAQGGHVEVLKEVEKAVEAALAAQKKQDRVNAQFTQGFNQVNQAVTKVISGAVQLPAAIAIPMSGSLQIDAQTRDGTTPLIAAVKASKPAAVQQLLTAGANAWIGDNTGATALHHAAWFGQRECLSLLLQHAEQAEAAGGRKCRLHDSTTNTGLSPLHIAAWRGQLHAIKQLVNAGAALAAATSHDTMGLVAANAGSTPLHLAAMKGEVGAIKLLLRANAKLMSLASVPGGASVVAAMPLNSGARGDLRQAADKYGKTAGMLAWDMQRSDLALILDASTPLDQAIALATEASAGLVSSAPAPTQAPQQQQLRSNSKRLHKQSSQQSRDSLTTQPATGMGSAADERKSLLQGTAGMQNASAVGHSSSTATRTSNTTAGSHGPGITLPPPKAWSSKTPGRSIRGSNVTDGCQLSSGAVEFDPFISQSHQQAVPESVQHQQVAGTSTISAAACPPCEPAAELSDSIGSTDTATDVVMPATAVFQAASMSPLSAEPPNDFVCPITLELLKDPVRACDGLAYEKEAIEMWFELGNKQLPGGAPITTFTLTADSVLKQAIDAWRTAGKLDHP